MKLPTVAGLFVALLTSAFCCPAAEPVTRDDLGRTVKYRILVDKVMQPTEGWVTKPWMIEAAAKAGFNVFSPRQGHDRLDEVRQVAGWCRKYGIFHMPWMRGSLGAPRSAEADGKRFVGETGLEQPLWSPNCDPFWDWTTRYVLAYAEISKENPHLIGVFLDYENYAPGRKEAGNLYRLSYDESVLGRFARESGTQLPQLEPARRKAWLEEQGLHKAFRQFQIDHWRARCRTLRQQVDRINPKFQFCIYPAPGTLFMVEACYREWATKPAPLILADASTYGRPGRRTPQREALEINRNKLIERRKVPKQAGIPFFYVGGIDPAVRGADPEFSGKNAVMISQVTDGYWVFYEGTKYDQGHRDYWKWFTWANRHIAEGNFEAQHAPRQTPEQWLGDVFRQFGNHAQLKAPALPDDDVELPVVRLRRDNLLVLACKKGRPVRLTLKNIPVSKYQSPLIWEARDRQLTPIASGQIPYKTTGEVSFTPKRKGVHLLAGTSGSCAWAVLKANVPVGLYVGERLRTIGGAERLYFQVPKSVGSFTITLQGSGPETVRGGVFDAQGRQVTSGQTSPTAAQAKLEVRTQGHAPGAWSLALTRADEGVLEDQSVRLRDNLAPVLALVPEQVFGLRPAEPRQ